MNEETTTTETPVTINIYCSCGRPADILARFAEERNQCEACFDADMIAEENELVAMRAHFHADGIGV